MADVRGERNPAKPVDAAAADYAQALRANG